MPARSPKPIRRRTRSRAGSVPTPPTRARRAGRCAATGAGWVLVCSDGLWNYCSGASDLAALIKKYETPRPDRARRGQLVDWANEQGGHDNITVRRLVDVTIAVGRDRARCRPQTRSS